MPRIRYLKKYTPIEVDYEDIQDREGQTNRSSTGLSGDSWLSNSTIIGSMSEAKIKQAISHYRNMANLLEIELKFRTDVFISYVVRDFKTFKVHEGFQQRNVENNNNKRRKINKGSKRNKLFKGLKITSELRKALLQCLEELRI